MASRNKSDLNLPEPMIAALYSTLMRMRNACFDAGILTSRSLPIPTISVGNITVGGTGKTPMVTKIAELLIAMGEKPCILTRGYGRKDASKRVVVSDGASVLADAIKGGDEPFEMATRLDGKAIIVADRNRLAAGEWAIGEFGATVAILDDGFQHRKVKRDLDVVCIDATDPFGNGKTLPTGKLREPLSSLKRADLLILTRSNLIDTSDLARINETVRLHSSNTETMLSENRTGAVTHIDGFSGRLENPTEFAGLKTKSGFLFCGLGNPQSFLSQMKGDGLEIVGHRFLRDHSTYDDATISAIENEARESGAAYLITTPKDAVKLANKQLSLPCFVVETIPMLADEKRFAEIIHEALSRK